jgi:hypothetical protein
LFERLFDPTKRSSRDNFFGMLERLFDELFAQTKSRTPVLLVNSARYAPQRAEQAH